MVHFLPERPNQLPTNEFRYHTNEQYSWHWHLFLAVALRMGPPRNDTLEQNMSPGNDEDGRSR
jgi:hypothetical protein